MPGPCSHCGATLYRMSIIGPGMCQDCEIKLAKKEMAERQQTWEGWRRGIGLGDGKDPAQTPP
jgi:hypothetical protein